MMMFYDTINITSTPFENRKIRKIIDQYIRELHQKYYGQFQICDPFARESFSVREPNCITNDMNPEFDKCDYNLEFKDFAELMEEQGQKFKLVLFDPPYNLTLLKKHYDGIGENLRRWQTHDMWGAGKNALARCIEPLGYAISLGYNTAGFGHKRGFDKIAIHVLRCRAREDQYDLLITVEQKRQLTLEIVEEE